MTYAFVDLNLVINALIAVGLGALIGLEREHREDKKMVIAGVRTFPMTSLTGVIFAFLSQELGYSLIDVGLLIFGGFAILLAYLKYEVHTIGITTPVAFFLTFLIGLMVQNGFIAESAFLTVLITLLLLTKERLHKIARNIGR
ncbi:MAG: MgtC/SapB family protein [Candidatus Saliniplasma sp.]